MNKVKVEEILKKYDRDVAKSGFKLHGGESLTVRAVKLAIKEIVEKAVDECYDVASNSDLNTGQLNSILNVKQRFDYE